MKATPIVTAVVIDFKAAQRAMKRQQQKVRATRAIVGAPRLTLGQSILRDEVRAKARAAL